MSEIENSLLLLEKLIAETGERYARGKYVIVAGIGMVVVEPECVKEVEDARAGDGVFKMVEVHIQDSV